MNHIHQYKRIKQQPSGRIIWRCMIANCSHYTTPEFILGKYSICPSCESQFIIDKVARDRAFPKCENCRGREPKGVIKKQLERPSAVSSPHLSKFAADILKKYDIG